MRLTSEWARNATCTVSSENLLDYSFIIQGKVGRGEDLLCLSGVDVMLPSSTSPPGWAGEFSCLYMAKLGPQIIIFFFLCIQRACPRDH